ncbi:unnamed protein product, partial [Rotaria magnacalcarata]
MISIHLVKINSDDIMEIEEDRSTDMSEEIEKDEPITNNKKEFAYKVFVHGFDEWRQSSEMELAILKDILHRIKTDTIVSASKLSEVIGIAVKRVDFCDPQGGKGPYYRYAAVIKSNIRRYLNENHNVTNALEFVDARYSYKGVKGVLAFDCRVNKDEGKKNKKCMIKQITNYNNFQYQTDGILSTSIMESDEMFKENQICSFFGRMKRGKETSTLKKLPIDADSENEGLEKFTDFETSVAEIITIENLFLNAKKALETSAAQKCISNNNLLVPEINASDFHETYYPTFKPYHTKRNSFNTRKLISRNDYARKKRKFDTAEAENFGLAFGITWKTFISVQQ